MEVEPEVVPTERLQLEPIGRQHADALHACTVDSQPELLPWMPWARDPSLESSRQAAAASGHAWIENRAFHFAVVERETGQVLGVVGLNREGPGVAEVHYWIRTDHAGRGLTTEACRALIDWARRALGVTALTLWAGTGNSASRRVAAKLGFAHLGPLDWQPEGGLGRFSAERYELDLSALP